MSALAGARRVVAIVVIAAALGGLATVTSAAPASAATLASDVEAALYARTNEGRAANGLGGLQQDRAARAVARTWAAKMADSASLGHNPNLVAEVDAYVTRQWTRLGENVGRGWSADQLADAFMASSPHRANILGAFNRVGVGAVRADNGQIYVALVFLQAPPLPPPPPPGSWAPFGAPEAFATQQYADFLSRAGDIGGVSFWSDRLRDGAISGPGVIEWFLDSPEFGGLIAPVVRMYLGGIGRLPDEPGLRYWLDTAAARVPIGAIAHSFAYSEEFQQRYAGLDDAGFVDALYGSIFGRPADPAGLGFWTGELASGRMMRGGVLLGLTSSPEFVWTTHAAAIVTMAYVGMLRRSPDPAGFDYWVWVLHTGHSIGEFAAGVLNSPEYRSRVGA